MVTDSGFTAVYVTGSEPAWLFVTRTQLGIVICDCDAPVERIERLIIEVSARRIPLVLSRPTKDHHVDRIVTLGHRGSWLTFTIAPETFAALLDALSPEVKRKPRVATRTIDRRTTEHDA
jgi:hypothetical protein